MTGTMLSYSEVFEASLRKLREDGRNRTFIELERKVGTFPAAIWSHLAGNMRALVEALAEVRTRLGWGEVALAAAPASSTAAIGDQHAGER
jgi:hypothetical protein